MRSLSKISLAVLAVSFLLVAGSAFAQDSGMQKPTLQITGIFNAGFGLESFDKYTNVVCGSACTNNSTTTTKSYSEWVTSYEHRIRFIYGTDDLTGKLVFRPRGESGGSNTACSESSGVNIGGAGVNVGTGASPGTNSSGAGSSVPSGAQGASGAQAIPGQPQSGGNPFLADIYGTITWKPIKALAIEFGRNEGPAAFDPIAGSYYMANPVMNGPEYWMNWTGQDGIVFTYDAGIFQAGVGVSSQCKPRCSTGNYQVLNGTGATAVTPNWSNTQSITPFINGKVGDIGFRAQAPMTSGDATLYENTSPGATGQTCCVPAGAGTGAPGSGTSGQSYTSKTRTESGSGYDIGVSFSGVPGMLIAANIQSFNVGKDTSFCQVTTTNGAAGSTASNNCKDWQRDAVDVKFEFQGLQIAWFDQTTDDGKGATNSKQEDTYIKVHYMFPVGPGVVGPEYTQADLGKRQLTGQGTAAITSASVNAGGASTTVNSGNYDGSYKTTSLSLIRLVGKVSF